MRIFLIDYDLIMGYAVQYGAAGADRFGALLAGPLECVLVHKKVGVFHQVLSSDDALFELVLNFFYAFLSALEPL
jgi:hypothetical protein